MASVLVWLFIFAFTPRVTVSLGMGTDISIPLQANTAKHVILPPESTSLFHLASIPSSVSYVVFHIHTQYREIQVSADGAWDITTSTIPGSNRGILKVLHSWETEATWFVNSTHPENVSAIAYATTYTSKNPVPGGCNQEFNIEINPNIHLSYDAYTTTLQFQFSNVGFPRTYIENQPDCELDANLKNLTYELYQFYLNENDLSEDMYFSAMLKMLDVWNITHHGTQISDSFQRGKHRSNFTIASYLGQGAIYAVVVKQEGPNYVSRSMYVPSASYGCNFTGKVDNCEARHNTASWVLCTFGGIVGLFLCFAGHRFFKTEMFLYGFMSFLLIFFIIFSVGTELSFTVRLILAAVFGIIGGCLWLTFWWFVGQPVVSVLLVGLVLGYLFSSIVFFTPFGNLDVWKSNFNYGMTFTCGVLLVPVFLLAFTRELNIVSCAVVGSYAFIVAINSYVHGSMAYILLNSVKRSVMEEFNSAIMIAPFQTRDIILSVIWGIVAISGLTFQLYREKKRPKFPDCPYQTYKDNKAHQVAAIDGANNERAPLLTGSTNRPKPGRAYGGTAQMQDPVQIM